MPCPRGHLVLGFKALHEPAPTHLSKSLYGSDSALCPEVPTKCLLSTQSLYVGKQSFYKEQVLLCSPAQRSLRRPTYGSPEAVLLLKLTIPLRKGGGGHSYHLPPARRPVRDRALPAFRGHGDCPGSRGSRVQAQRASATESVSSAEARILTRQCSQGSPCSPDWPLNKL